MYDVLTINQLMTIFDLQDSKPLMLWMINIPEDDYVRLEGDSIVLHPNITEDQINRVVNSLMSHLTAEINID